MPDTWTYRPEQSYFSSYFLLKPSLFSVPQVILGSWDDDFIQSKQIYNLDSIMVNCFLRYSSKLQTKSQSDF